MVRPANPVSTVQLRISTTPAIQAKLEDLVETGLYGKNSAEAAERVIAEAVRRMIVEGVFLRPDGEGS